MVSAAIVLGIALAFCFGTSDYLSKGLTAWIGFYRTTVYTLIASGAMILVPILFLGVPAWPSYADDAQLALISVSTFVAFLLMYRAYQRGNLSIVSPTVNAFPIFSVLFAVFVLNIELSSQALLALSGVIVGIFLVSSDFSALGSPSGRRLTPGVTEAIVAALFLAVALTSLGYAEVKMGFLFPAMAARFGAAAVGVLAGFASKQDMRPFGGSLLRRLLVMGALEASGLMAFSLALFYSASIVPLPITSTLGGMGAVFTVGYALVLMKEKLFFNYAVGILVLIASVGALLYLTA